MVYSPLDALRDRAREPGPRGGLLRDRLRDDGALDGADADAGEGRGGPATSRSCATTCSIVPPLRALLESPGPAARRLRRPGPRLDRGRRAALRVHPGRLRQADGDRRLRAARHPPGHPHDAARSSPRAAARSRTSTRAWCPGRATRRRSRCWPRCSSCGRTSSGAGSGFISQSALRLSDAYADLDAELRFACRACGSPTPRPASAARC